MARKPATIVYPDGETLSLTWEDFVSLENAEIDRISSVLAHPAPTFVEMQKSVHKARKVKPHIPRAVLEDKKIEAEERSHEVEKRPFAECYECGAHVPLDEAKALTVTATDNAAIRHAAYFCWECGRAYVSGDISYTQEQME